MSSIGKKESRDSLIDLKRQSSKESQDLNVNDLKKVGQKHKAINQKVFNFPASSGNLNSRGVEFQKPFY